MIGIIDYKVSENSDKAADLQLCGYANLVYDNFKEIPEFRMALELHGDGTYDTLFYKTPIRIWDSVMKIYRWKITRRTKELREVSYGSTTRK